MSYASQPDLGPLTWVKGEIDLALGRAADALEQAAASPESAKSLQFAQTHLHQVRGALSIVGLDGLAQFADALDRLLSAQARGALEVSPAHLALARRGLAAMGNYLEELIHGAPDQALRLAGLYEEIGCARGEDAQAADLFFPDLGLRPPGRAEPAPLAPEEEQKLLKALRGRFERGLLKWLRSPADKDGALEMREAVAGIEARQANPAVRSLWWASLAFFDGLAAGEPPDLAATRKLCTRLDAQMRRLLAGAPPTNDKVMRELLHHLATHPATTEHQRQVREVFGLDALVPPPGSAVRDAPLGPVVKQLRETLAGVREAWDQFSAGTAAALPKFAARIQSLEEHARTLGRPTLTRLVEGLASFTEWLRRDPLQLTEALTMEVAGALLLAESALDANQAPAGFGLRVDDSLALIRARMDGTAPDPALAAAAAEAARNHEQRDATAQLARELLTTLALVEQGLDAYFRNPAQREPLAAVSAPLSQLSGALTLLDDPAPQALVEEAAATIRGYLASEAQPDPAGFETLAQQLSALGFYLEALRQGPARLADFLPGAALPAPAEEAPAPAEIPTIVPVVLEQPLLPAEDEEELEVAELAPIPPPDAQAQALMTASEEALDAELLAIFIEEAHEVLDNIANHLQVSIVNSADLAALTTVRRGFHTLKGSGRMVGLKDLGEAAWGLEQTLNHWLQLEWTPTPALHRLIETAHGFFAEWVVQLENGGSAWRDASALAAEAEALRAGDSPAAEAAAPVVVAEAAQEAGFDLEALDLVVAETEEDLVLEDALDELEEATPVPTEIVAAETLEVQAAPALDDLAELDLGELDLVAEASGELPGGELEEAPLLAAEAAEAREALVFAETDEAPAIEFAAEEALEVAALEDEPGEPETLETLAAIEAREALEALEASETPADALELAEASTIEFAAEEPLEVAALEDEPGEPETLETLEAIEAREALEALEAPADVLDVAEVDLVAAEPLEEASLEDEPGEPETLETLEAIEALETLEPAELSELVTLGEEEISRPLYDLFLAEARQHLATLRRELARLHVNPVLLPPEPAIRAAHTLAGIAGTTGVEAAQQLARALEQAQSRLSDSAQPPNAEQAALLSAAAATLETMVAQVSELREPVPAVELIAQLDRVARLPMAEIRPFTVIQGQGRPAVDRPAPERAPELVSPPPPPQAAEEPVPALAAVRDDIDEQLLPIFQEEAEELFAQLGTALRHWREEPADTARVDTVARLMHTLKGSARMTGAMVLGEFLHHQESRLESGRARPSLAFIDDIEAALDTAGQMRQGLGSTPDAASSPAPAAEAESEAGAATTILRVRADLVDRFVNEAGEIGIARTRVEGELRTLRRSLLDLTENVIRLRNQLREVEIQAEMQMHTRITRAESQHGEFDPLEMDRYTRLQELTRMMAESVGDVTTVQQSLLKNLDGADAAVTSQARLSRDLQQALMRVRMVRFDSLADRLHRVVRQSAKDLWKRANLDLRGGAIEIDRGVLEHMTAPLEHLLRNAVAHGIETPEGRHAAGKAEIGEITLSVSQEGNEIVLDLADDGTGLDFQRILEKSRAQGLLGPDEEADEKRLTNLIFVPGFSTAGSVSTVSGRGVGMDVVKAETSAVGGRIDVQSSPGAGTRFRIYLPLTLAVTQALLVRAGHRSYAIPSSMVAQVMELKPDALEKLRREGATEWMGERFGYRYLPELLGDRQAQPEIHKFNWILLLRAGAQTLALHVDGLKGNQEIVVKNAGPQLTRIVGMSGATVLGDGEIVLIVNPVALASRHLTQVGEAGKARTLSMPGNDYQPTVLVVDDSLTVRKITGRLLEREGYRVLTAKDGVDALERLLDVVPDMILSDIEMPRMDGFDLVRNIRADRRLSAVPIVMITSRLADKHRRYAMEVGANHYLGKPYQEEELLGLIRGYVGEVAAA